MFAKLRQRLSYANVMATIAVMIAMGGTAYAAATVTGADVVDESLTGADIQNKSIGGSDIGGATLGSAKIIDNSLGAIDLAPNSVGTSEAVDNSLTGTDIDESSLQGVKISGLVIVDATSATNSNSNKAAEADCPAGTKVVGTGYDINGGKSGSVTQYTSAITADAAHNFGTYVVVVAYESQATSLDWSISAQATCANAE